MARFKRIYREDDERESQRITHAEVNSRMQNSANATVGKGAGVLGDMVTDAVMSGIKVIVWMVALVIVLWLLTF